MDRTGHFPLLPNWSTDDKTMFPLGHAVSWLASRIVVSFNNYLGKPSSDPSSQVWINVINCYSLLHLEPFMTKAIGEWETKSNV